MASPDKPARPPKVGTTPVMQITRAGDSHHIFSGRTALQGRRRRTEAAIGERFRRQTGFKNRETPSRTPDWLASTENTLRVTTQGAFRPSL